MSNVQAPANREYVGFFEMSREARIDMLFAEAAVMRSEGFVRVSAWRKKLAVRVGKKHMFDQGAVYNFMTSIGIDRVAELRKACIGEEADAAFIERCPTRGSGGSVSPNETLHLKPAYVNPPTESDEARRERIAAEYRHSLSLLPEDGRTIQAVAREMKLAPFAVASYALANSWLAQHLIDKDQLLAVFRKTG